MTAPAMKVKGLSVSLPQPDGMTRILDAVDLELAPAEMAGLAGESGCGKSLLARALMGLLEGTGARVEAVSLSLGGRAVTSPACGFTADRGRRIAMVFQEPATALDPAFTIGWQLRTVLRRRFGYDRNKAHRRAIEALFDAGLTEAERVYRAYPHQLSGGMQQRAMIAMAAALEPEVLIADEPTTALDVTTQRLVMDQLEKLRQSAGTAILLISHDIGLIAEYCSRISIMYCGQIVESAAYADFYHRPRHPYSSALLQALPRLHDRQPPAPLKGAVASPAEWPTGCRFAPRCPQASDRCREQAPAALTDEDRMFACHHPL